MGPCGLPCSMEGLFFLPTGFRVLSPFHWCLQCPQACSRGPHSIKKGCHTLPGPSQYWFTPVFPLLFPFRRQILRRSARRPPQTRGAQPSKGQGSPSTPLQFMEGRLEPSGHAALPRRLLYCIHLAQDSRDFSDRGGRQPLGLFGLPWSMEGHFFCPPVSGCSHLFIGVFNAPRHAVEVPSLY